MAVSPVFNEERTFETRMATRSQQEIQKNPQSGQILILHVYDITVEEEFYEIARVLEEECHRFFEYQREESNIFMEEFASQEMAFERTQELENMKTILQEKARQLKKQPKESMSEQERKVYRTEMELFRIMQLNQLLSFSLFHAICLKRIQIIGSKDFEPLREAILVADEVVQTFQGKLLDHNFTIEDFDNSFWKKEEKVEELLEDSVFFKGQLLAQDEIQYTRRESRISFTLGLEVDFLEKLTLYDDEMIFHWSIQEWILNFLTNNYDSIENEYLKKNLSKVLLTKLGFRENSKAIQTIMSRSAQMADHVEPVEFAKRFVKDEIKYNPVLSQKLSRFPIIDQPNIHYKVKAGTTVVDAMNVGHREGYLDKEHQHIAEHISRLSDEDSVVLFHGTDHYSALDIMHRGIDVRLGQPKRDFSDGWGFYLTNDYEHALTWSISQTRKPAVLVFKVHKSFLASSSCLDLTQDEKKSEWLQIVKECRSGRRSKKLRNRLKTYDIVEGPISKRSSDDENEPFEPRQDSHQLCVINEDCGDELREYLDTVIFYE